MAKVRRSRFTFLVALATLIVASAPAYGHFPVALTSKHTKLKTSPILIDGTISYAVTASFSAGKQERIFRFSLESGEDVNLQYLILDKAPTNKLRKSQLPTVTLVAPNGVTKNIRVNEKTSFYEPYGGNNYFYLSRISEVGEAGIYSVIVRSKVKSSAVIAVGMKEVPGNVLQFGVANKQCPNPVNNEQLISQDRADQLIGMSESAAQVCAAANEWIFRVGERDGEFFPLTRDYRTNRVTVSVKSDIITGVVVG